MGIVGNKKGVCFVMYSFDIVGNKEIQTFKITQGDVGKTEGYVSNTNPLCVSPVSPSLSSVAVISSSPYSQTIVLANSDRRGVLISNETDGDLVLLFSSGVAANDNYSLRLNSNNILKLGPDDYCGEINGFNEGVGTVRITEMRWK